MANTFDTKGFLTGKCSTAPKGDKHQVKIKSTAVVLETKPDGKDGSYILIVMEYANGHVTPARFYGWDCQTVVRDLRTQLDDYTTYASFDEFLNTIVDKELTVWKVVKDGYLKYRFVEPVVKTETTDDETTPF